MNISDYYKKLGSLPMLTEVSSPDVKTMTIPRAVSEMADLLRSASRNGHVCYFCLLYTSDAADE